MTLAIFIPAHSHWRNPDILRICLAAPAETDPSPRSSTAYLESFSALDGLLGKVGIVLITSSSFRKGGNTASAYATAYV
jgi:hypothetical protein